MEIHVQSFGARLRMRGGIFVLTIPDLTGAGHDQEHEFAPHQVQCILLFEQAGSISTDAVTLALQHRVAIFLTDKMGNVKGRFQSEEPEAHILIQATQYQLMGTPRSLQFVKEWHGLKLSRMIKFLQRLERYRDGEKVLLLRSSRQELAEYAARLNRISTSSVPKAAQYIRAIEMHTAKLYYATLAKLLPAEYTFEGRSRRPAQDIFNAFLNYGYGILYRQVESVIVKAGLSPWPGFLHSIERNKKAFLFDWIEPYRVWVDVMVFTVFSRKMVSAQHITAHQQGFWLSPKGAALLLETFFDNFTSKQNLDTGEMRSMETILVHETEKFAGIIRQEWKSMKDQHVPVSAD